MVAGSTGGWAPRFVHPGAWWLWACCLGAAATQTTNPMLLLLALGAVVVLPIVFDFVGIGKSAWWLSLLRWPVLLLAVLGGLALLYRYGPSRNRAKWRWVTWGSALAAVAWLITSLGFSWYVANFGKYNETYGSLGAVMVHLRETLPEDAVIISCGGVTTAADVTDRLGAGADLVQGYTAFLYEGPFWARRINQGLARRAGRAWS